MYDMQNNHVKERWRIMKKILLSVFAGFAGIFACSSAAMAVCPVCTVAVGAGLEGARLLGVDDVITGIWAGAVPVFLDGWLVKKTRRVQCVVADCGAAGAVLRSAGRGVFNAWCDVWRPDPVGNRQVPAGGDCRNNRVLSGRALVCKNKAR